MQGKISPALARCRVSFFGISCLVFCLFLPRESFAEESLSQGKALVATLASTDFKKASDCYPAELCKKLKPGRTLVVAGEIPGNKGTPRVLLLSDSQEDLAPLVSVSEEFLRLSMQDHPRAVRQKQGIQIFRGELPENGRTPGALPNTQANPLSN